MEWCAAVEALPRGIYSGALGWIAGDGSADLSVVIRTILLEGKRLEFQVGGGIVADSEPYAEWEETLTKAAAICEVLGISQEEIAAL
jgi:anthranilate/para-aminobenzoate synthase component I